MEILFVLELGCLLCSFSETILCTFVTVFCLPRCMCKLSCLSVYCVAKKAPEDEPAYVVRLSSMDSTETDQFMFSPIFPNVTHRKQVIYSCKQLLLRLERDLKPSNYSKHTAVT